MKAREILRLKEDRIRLAEQELRAERARVDAKTKQAAFVLTKLSTVESESTELRAQLGQLERSLELARESSEPLESALKAERERSGWLKRLLRKAQEDSRASSMECEMLGERLRIANEELVEGQAKYGLLGDDDVKSVIERQQGWLQENTTLRQRLMSKEYQVSELRERHQKLAEQLDEANAQIERLGSAAAERDGALAELREQCAALRARVERKQRQKRELGVQLADVRGDCEAAEARGAAAAERCEVLGAELTLANERVDAFVDERRAEGERIEVLGIREQLLKSDLQVAREESKAKDKQLRELRDNLTSLNAQIQQLSFGGSGGGASSSSKSSSKPRGGADGSSSNDVQRLRAQLEQAVAACRAHQSQNGYLASEIARLESEKSSHLQLKERTIERLYRELEISRRHCRALRLDLAAAKVEASIGDADELERCFCDDDDDEDDGGKDDGGRQRASTIDRIISPEQLRIEDLKTELEVARRDYFFALVVSVKMQYLAQQERSINVDAASMYDACAQQRVRYRRWSEWVRNRCDQEASEQEKSDREQRLAVEQRLFQ
jgi:hypothetical protein